MLVALAVARAVEILKLYHAAPLDAFRATLPGAILFGRGFSIWNLAAYAVAIGVGGLADRFAGRAD